MQWGRTQKRQTSGEVCRHEVELEAQCVSKDKRLLLEK